MADRYVAFKGKNGQWYWHRKAGNNEIVASSEGYTTRDAALTEAHRQADPAGLDVILWDGPFEEVGKV